MVHLLFFLLVLSLSLGVGVLVQLGTMNRHANQPAIAWYMTIQAFLGLAVFSDLLTIYVSLVLPEKSGLSFAGTLFYHLTLGGIAGSLLPLTGALLRRPINRSLRILFAVFLVVFPLAIAIFFITGMEFFSYIGEGLVLVLVTITIVRLYPRQETDSAMSPPHRRIGTLVMFLLAVFLPLFIMEILFEGSIVPAGSIYLSTSVFMLGLYLVWNVLNLTFVVGQFREAYPAGMLVPSREKMAGFHLSKREQDIAALIIEGTSNKMIGAKLVISTSTVKNHIYSIYQKTGVGSRVELVLVLTR